MIERPSASTRFWTACETSPRWLPGRACSTAACSDASVVSSSCARLGRDLADADGDRGVGDPALVGHADVERDDVAARAARRGRGCRGRPSSSARRRSSRGSRGSRGTRGSAPCEVMKRSAAQVELLGGDARAHLRAQHLQAARLDRAGGRHLLDLLGGLEDDPAAIHRRSRPPPPSPASPAARGSRRRPPRAPGRRRPASSRPRSS